MRDDFDSNEDGSMPWTGDPDAWRGAAEATGGSWPQLAAGPQYWMWLEVLERERGVNS